MKSFTLQAGVDPDLIACDGWMYGSYQDVALGLTVARWQGDGSRRELVYLDQGADGRGRLCVVTGDVVISYQVKDETSPTGVAVIGVDVLTSERALWSVPCLGSQPLAWSPLGDLAVQRPPDCHVLVGRWPAEPALPLGPGIGSGLSRLEIDGHGALQIVTVNDDFYIHRLGDQPHVLPGDSFATAGQTGGIRCRLDGVDGLLLPGQEAFQPRLCKQPDGAWTVLYGGRDSRGATAQTLLTDVTAADLVPLDWHPPVTVPTILPFNAPKFIEGANAVNLDGKVKTLDGRFLASWCDLEQSRLRGETDASALNYPKPRIAYWNDRAVPPESILSHLLHGEMVGLRCFREPNEPAAHLYDLMSLAAWMLHQRGLKLVPVCGFSDRLGTLTEAQVVECVSTVYAPLLRRPNVPGALCFGIGRGDGTTKHPIFAECISALGAASPGVPDLSLPTPTPTPPAPTPVPTPTPAPLPAPTKGPRPMKPDQELRAYIRNDVAPALEKIGVPNPAGLAQQVADTFRNARPEAEGGFGSKARDPLPTEFEFFCRVLHKGGVIANLVKESLQ